MTPDSEPHGMGEVIAIYLCASPDVPGVSVRTATAEAGRGLVGDRYHAGTGTYSQRPGTGRALTLIEAEVLEDLARTLARTLGPVLTPAESRRNLVTRDIRLDDLLGRRFRIGPVECEGARPCHPCAILEQRTHPGMLKALASRGGLRVDVLSDGDITVGDRIRCV